jgi:hypothetical protein
MAVSGAERGPRSRRTMRAHIMALTNVMLARRSGHSAKFLFDHLVGAGEQRRRDGDTKSFLGMLFIASARYRIKFAHTARYKTKPHVIAINVSQIAILPNLGTCP